MEFFKNQTTFEGIKCATRRYTIAYLFLFLVVEILLLLWYTRSGVEFRGLTDLEAQLLISAISFGLTAMIYLINLNSIHQTLTKKIRDLIKAIRAIEPENPTTEISMDTVGCDDELYQIVEAINDKSRQIQRHIDYLKELVGYIQHEFNTPLTVMNLELSLLEKNQPDSFEHIVSLREEIKIMNGLSGVINQLLLDDDYSLDEKSFVTTLIKDIAKELGKIYPSADISISLTSNITTYVQSTLVRIIIKNLMDNAIKHGSPSIVVSTKGNIIKVQDFGPGIEKKALSKIWLPFWRAKESSTTGFGLGLTLVKRLVEKIGWALDVTSSDTGTTFIITVLS